MRKLRKSYTILLAILISLVVAGLTVAGIAYKIIFAPNVHLAEQDSIHINIASGSSYADVLELLEHENIVKNISSFDRLAHRKNYPNRVMSGRYLIDNRMSNNELINLLRSGEQDPVRLTFTSIRTEEDLAGSIARQLEIDSTDILQHIRDTTVIRGSGLSTPNIKLLFIPNTYQVYWNITAEQLVTRMQREFNAFWNDTRRERAMQIGLSPEEIGILASIVQSETNKVDEMPRIAGVYINRISRNMPLQACPTVIYAIGDFSITRLLDDQLDFDSPYNTYLHLGLPPGPVNLPEPAAIDAVLNYESHNYLFFSANPDFSGYHVFARTHREHMRNARIYQQKLNEMRIFR
jgi:UPF0755 protein